MADDARPTCERCRRPEATWHGPSHAPPPTDACDRAWTSSASLCDRLLLAERDASAERALRYERERNHLAAERDALAEAGDALAESLSSARLYIPSGFGGASLAVLDRWRSLRSPKGAGNGD